MCIVSGRMLDAEDDAHGVACDEQFLIGGDHPDLDASALAIYAALLAVHHCRVAVRIELHAHPLKAVADARPDTARVLADAASEDDRVGAIHRSEIRADVLPRAVREEIDREARAPILVLGLLGEELAHVVGEAGHAEQPRLLVEYPLNFR